MEFHRYTDEYFYSAEMKRTHESLYMDYYLFFNIAACRVR